MMALPKSWGMRPPNLVAIKTWGNSWETVVPRLPILRQTHLLPEDLVTQDETWWNQHGVSKIWGSQQPNTAVVRRSALANFTPAKHQGPHGKLPTKSLCLSCDGTAARCSNVDSNRNHLESTSTFGKHAEWAHSSLLVWNKSNSAFLHTSAFQKLGPSVRLPKKRSPWCGVFAFKSEKPPWCFSHIFTIVSS